MALHLIGASPDLITTHDHIIYIAERALEQHELGNVPLDQIEAYAHQYAVALRVHTNIRQFVAREAAKKVVSRVDNS